jgi:hypothetical protein
MREHGLRMILVVLVLFALFSLIVMLLWNAVMPDLITVGSMDYPRAAGLLALCRILFGGLGPGFRGRTRREHFHNMNPEQREALIRRMHDRFPGHAAPRYSPGGEDSHGRQVKHSEAGENSSHNGE